VVLIGLAPVSLCVEFPTYRSSVFMSIFAISRRVIAEDPVVSLLSDGLPDAMPPASVSILKAAFPTENCDRLLRSQTRSGAKSRVSFFANRLFADTATCG
jgi:hypothetical protein